MTNEAIINQLQIRIMAYRKQEQDAREFIRNYGDDNLQLPEAYATEAEFYETILQLIQTHTNQ